MIHCKVLFDNQKFHHTPNLWIFLWLSNCPRLTHFPALISFHECYQGKSRAKQTDLCLTSQQVCNRQESLCQRHDMAWIIYNLKWINHLDGSVPDWDNPNALDLFLCNYDINKWYLIYANVFKIIGSWSRYRQMCNFILFWHLASTMMTKSSITQSIKLKCLVNRICSVEVINSLRHRCMNKIWIITEPWDKCTKREWMQTDIFVKTPDAIMTCKCFIADHLWGESQL